MKTPMPKWLIPATLLYVIAGTVYIQALERQVEARRSAQAADLAERAAKTTQPVYPKPLHVFTKE